MLKKLLFALAIALQACGWAQAKFGIINVDSVIDLQPETLAAKAQIDEASKNYEDENNRLAAEINKKVEEYQALPTSTPLAIRERRQQEIQDLDSRFQAFLLNAQEDLANLKEELFEPIRLKVNEAIKAIGTEQGYDMIIPAGTAIFTGASFTDITEEVVNRLSLTQQQPEATEQPAQP